MRGPKRVLEILPPIAVIGPRFVRSALLSRLGKIERQPEYAAK